MQTDAFDAHVHTDRSDAAPSQTPYEVCRAAKAAGVRHLCIADYDRLIPGQLRLELSQTYDLDVISGCAFNGVAALPGGPITVHVIGMWLPSRDLPPVLSAVLACNQNQDFKGYSKAMLEKLLQLGIDPSGKGVDASLEMLRKRNPNTTYFGKDAVAGLLAETGCAASTNEAKKRWLSAGGERLAYVPAGAYCHYVPFEDAMAAANTGLSVLCRLYDYGLTAEQKEKLLRRFKKLGGQALEVDCGAYTPEQQAELMRYCKQYDLLPVAASGRREAETPFQRGDSQWFYALRDRCRALHGELPDREGSV